MKKTVVVVLCLLVAAAAFNLALWTWVGWRAVGAWQRFAGDPGRPSTLASPGGEREPRRLDQITATDFDQLGERVQELGERYGIFGEGSGRESAREEEDLHQRLDELERRLWQLEEKLSASP